MNDDNFSLIDKYVSHGYVQQGREARRVLEKNIRQLLEQGKIPASGWSDLSIKHLLQEISLMDSNNFPDNCGVGEREARIACSLVSQRHFYLGHGIGRSGDIAEIQPKAAGSSLLAKLANSFALDVIKMQGVKLANSCLLVPVATGMALVLTMITLKESRPNAKYVIWPRIDQKSCFKSILTSGLEPIIIENLLVDDHLETDTLSIENVINNVGAENILCVLTTTSCFAPRIPDKLEDVALMCKEHEIPHVINNAYGVQSSKCMHLIQQASRVGRVDAFVQSTDKNFMVPVGGAIIAGFNKPFIQSVGKMYPGRASASPIIDFFITMLSLGASGYNGLLKERKELYEYLKSGLQEVSRRYGEQTMDIKQNQISIAVTLGRVDAVSGGEKESVTEFGSYLFKRSVSGTRVVTPYDSKTIGKYTFKGWGAHHNSYPTSYFTAAAAIGTTKTDIEQFLKRLDKTFKLFIKDPLSTPLKTPVPVCSVPPSVDPTRTNIPTQLQPYSSYSIQSSLRPTRSLIEKPCDSNTNFIPKPRPGSFSSYHSLTNTWPSGGAREDSDSDRHHNVHNASRAPIDYNRSYSDSGNSSLFVRQNSHDSSRGSTSSRDSSLARTNDFTQQLLIPGEIPPDKMSFLIDI